MMLLAASVVGGWALEALWTTSHNVACTRADEASAPSGHTPARRGPRDHSLSDLLALTGIIRISHAMVGEAAWRQNDSTARAWPVPSAAPPSRSSMVHAEARPHTPRRPVCGVTPRSTFATRALASGLARGVAHSFHRTPSLLQVYHYH